MTTFTAANPEEMDALGQSLGRALQTGVVVYLQGELGAGKTTFVRGVLKGLGHVGPVRSPTYTLVEGYDVPGHVLYHLDLYRIRGLAELEYLGIRDLDAPALWVFVEWPERGAGGLPAADVTLRLEMRDPGRVLHADAASERGRTLVAAWLAQINEAPATIS